MQLVNSRIIRNKQTSQSECYGFIEFSSHAAAERILQTYNNTLMPNVEQNYRLNWASYGSGEKRGEDGSDYRIFVGDLASDVTERQLQTAKKLAYKAEDSCMISRALKGNVDIEVEVSITKAP